MLPIAIAAQDYTSETVADFVYDHIILQHGCPNTIIKDQGSHFKNSLIKRLNEKLTINHSLTSPYNPRCNGLTEHLIILCVEEL